MRIYIAPCGIGLGHVGRTLPIAKELSRKKAQIVFSTYLDGIAYVQNEGFRLIKAPPLGLQVKPDGSIDFRRTAINPGPFLASFMILRQIRAETDCIQNFEPDVVVSDSRASTILAARLLRIPRVVILNEFQAVIPRTTHHLLLAKLVDYVTLTLLGSIWTCKNTLLIPDFPSPYTVAAGNLNIPESYSKNVELIGPILPIRPDELDKPENLRSKLNLPVDKRIIFVPISGPKKEKAYFTELIMKIISGFSPEFEVIISLGDPSKPKAPVQKGNTTIFNWVPNRFEYLKACDVVIGRAGHGTITQTMSYGKPMIIVPTPNQTEQIYNAAQAERLGMGKVIPQKNLNRESLAKGIRLIFESEMLKKAEETGKIVSEFDGLKKAVEIVLEVARNGKHFKR